MGHIITDGAHQHVMQNIQNTTIPSPDSMSERDHPASPGIPRSPGIRSYRTESEEPGEGGEMGYTPRRGHSYKRLEDPPRNEQNKMICKFADSVAECRPLTFDRKCEWSKHMDKHDRPYKCAHKGCEKLQGFTYSGGLLRHEREVHKLHGGTKKALFCPHADCKRSSGQGFTRKENLAEHIRRVHRTASGLTDPGLSLESPRVDSIARIVESPEADEPGMEMVDPQLRKRKRYSTVTDRSDISGETDVGDLRAEIKRLRKENEEKDDRLRRLEAVVANLEQQQQHHQQQQQQQQQQQNGVVVS